MCVYEYIRVDSSMCFESHPARQTHIQTGGQRHRVIVRERRGEGGERERERETDRQTDRQIDRQTETERGIQAES